MRHIWIWITILLMLFLVARRSEGQTLPQADAPQAQQLPDSPAPALSTPPQNAPARPPDALWFRVQQLFNGQEILVYSTYGTPMRCRFAGATDAYLFCDPPGSPVGAGYRFDRASVLNVTVVRPPRNWHPAWISSMIAGGVFVGLAATTRTDAAGAAGVGVIGAGVVGLIGAPLAFLPHDSSGGSAFFPLAFGHGFAGLRFSGHARLSRLR